MLIGLLCDPYPEICGEAAGLLGRHEPSERTPVYLALLKDPDSNVRMHALGVATWINRYKIPQELFNETLKMLRDPNEDVQYSTLRALWRMNREEIPRADLLRLLSSPRSDIYMMALNLLQRGPPGPRVATKPLSSAETAPLMTKPSTMARLYGVKILQQNADAEAVELILPLLNDTNSIVRNRAFAVLQTITDQNISDKDPAKWESWWAANKSSFKPRKPQQ